MERLQTNRYNWADLSLLITTIVYIFINGAGAFETLVIVPKWTAGPPSSLSMFHGTYGLDFKNFWIAAHSFHELTFIAAIVLNWRIPGRRKALLLIFGLHMAVRVWTIVYFVPTIISFQQMNVSDTVDEVLRQKAQLWKQLNLVRVIFFTILSFALVPLNKQYFLGHTRRDTRLVA